MKARKLKEILNTQRPIQEIADKICIGSYYVTDLIAINKKTLKLTYALDTFHEGRKALKSKELEDIWDKLEKMIEDNSIKEIIDNNDPIENMKEFYYFDSVNNNIIKSYTDNRCWPNVDYTGKLIYDNTSFDTYDECKEYAINDLIKQLHYVQDRLNRLNKEYIKDMDNINGDLISIQKALEYYISEK